MILLLYVDDLFLTWENKTIIECKKKLAAKFDIKDLGMMHYFLDLEVWQYLDEIFLNQGKYAVEILKIFGMIDCKAMTTSMKTNLKLLNDYTLKSVDATLILESSWWLGPCLLCMVWMVINKLYGTLFYFAGG